MSSNSSSNMYSQFKVDFGGRNEDGGGGGGDEEEEDLSPMSPTTLINTLCQQQNQMNEDFGGINFRQMSQHDSAPQSNLLDEDIDDIYNHSGLDIDHQFENLINPNELLLPGIPNSNSNATLNQQYHQKNLNSYQPQSRIANQAYHNSSMSAPRYQQQQQQQLQQQPVVVQNSKNGYGMVTSSSGSLASSSNSAAAYTNPNGQMGHGHESYHLTVHDDDVDDEEDEEDDYENGRNNRHLYQSTAVSMHMSSGHVDDSDNDSLLNNPLDPSAFLS